MLQIGDTFKDGSAVFKVKKFGADGALVGSVTWYAGAGTPENYLLCDGSAVSRTNYADLFAVIGITYGAGDGSTTFNLPLLTDSRFIEGSNAPGTQHEAGLPNIEGSNRGSGHSNSEDKNSVSSDNSLYAKGAFWNGEYFGVSGTGAPDSYFRTLYFDASKADPIYGNSATVQPQSLTLRPLIKYI